LTSESVTFALGARAGVRVDRVPSVFIGIDAPPVVVEDMLLHSLKIHQARESRMRAPRAGLDTVPEPSVHWALAAGRAPLSSSEPAQQSRLVDAVLAEQHDEWAEQRRHLDVDVLG
jgi:hypothetical protein